jgi:hypothetical protein
MDIKRVYIHHAKNGTRTHDPSVRMIEKSNAPYCHAVVLIGQIFLKLGKEVYQITVLSVFLVLFWCLMLDVVTVTLLLVTTDVTIDGCCIQDHYVLLQEPSLLRVAYSQIRLQTLFWFAEKDAYQAHAQNRSLAVRRHCYLQPIYIFSSPKLPETQIYKQTPWPLVRKRTIPTDRPPLVDEI